MSQLNQSAIRRTQDIISCSCFSLSDFDIQLPKSGQNLLIITFKHNPAYEFRIFEKTKKTKIKENPTFSTFGPSREEVHEYISLVTKISPGKYKTSDEDECDDYENAVNRILYWCDNITKELSIILKNESEYDDIRNQFEEQFKKFAGNENERFTTEELGDLNEKFNILLEKFEFLNEENKIRKEELSRIKNEIEKFKNNAKTFPKGVWAKVTNNKLMDILISFAKSSEGRQLIIDEVRKMIGV